MTKPMRARDLEAGKWYLIPDNKPRHGAQQRFSRWQFKRSVRVTRSSWKRMWHGGKIVVARADDQSAQLVHLFGVPRKGDRFITSTLDGVKLDERQTE